MYVCVLICTCISYHRRNVHLLKLMFVRSKKIRYVKKPCRVLRGNIKKKFELMSRCSIQYLHSPLYRGSILWDKLSPYIQKQLSVKVFSKHVCHMNREYLDLLG